MSLIYKEGPQKIISKQSGNGNLIFLTFHYFYQLEIFEKLFKNNMCLTSRLIRTTDNYLHYQSINVHREGYSFPMAMYYGV